MAAVQVGRFSPSFDAFAQSFQIDYVSFGWLVSLITLASALVGIVAGLVAVSLGLTRSIVLGGYVLAALALLSSLAPSFAVLITIRVLEGFAYLAVVVAAPTVIAATIRPDQRTSALAFWGTFFVVGISLASVLGGTISEQSGWRLWFGLCAGTTALTAIFAAKSIQANLSPEPVEGAVVATFRNLPSSLWMLSSAFLITTLLSVAILSMLPLFLYDNFDLSKTEAGALAGLIALGSLAGNLFYGRASSKFSDRRMYTLSSICAGSAAFIAFDATNLLTSIIGCVFVLFFVGVLVAMSFAAVPRLANDTKQVGAANGLLTQMGGAGALVGPPVIGTIAMRFGWPALVYLLVILCLLELIFLRLALKQKV